MINIQEAKEVFEKYLQKFDMEEDKLKLKKLHTYKTMELVSYITENEKINEEDSNLALLIALLHDIGRFKQYEMIHSFNDLEISHAKLAVEYLFDEEHIKDFIETRHYDNIIKSAILHHSDYKLPEDLSSKELLHCKIIRDVDKLDNFRVKNEEKIETLLDISKEELGEIFMSDAIYDTVMNSQLIESKNRKTKMDMWISWIAFMFDLNFKSSYKYLYENDSVNSNINRITYTNDNTSKKMRLIQKHCKEYISRKIAQ